MSYAVGDEVAMCTPGGAWYPVTVTAVDGLTCLAGGMQFSLDTGVQVGGSATLHAQGADAKAGILATSERNEVDALMVQLLGLTEGELATIVAELRAAVDASPVTRVEASLPDWVTAP